MTAAALILLSGSPAHAAPQAVPLFNGWTFEQWFPALFEQATEAMGAMGPIAWLVMGALLAGLAIEEIFRLVWVARRGPEEDEAED